MTREVVLLGSTGSVGTQAIDVIRAAGDRFRVVAIAAGGGNVDLLAEQALELGVAAVGVAKATAAEDVLLALYAAAQRRGYDRGEFAVPKVLAGPDAASEIAQWPCDSVLNGMTGAVGLRPTLAALEAGRTLALANKESLIVGGPLVTKLVAGDPQRIVPVDSEHSALAQCLAGVRREDVSRLVLTASGGPFRGRAADELADVTVEQALAHPTWDMGPVITVNCATLVNKGLEVIEAHLLFGIPIERVHVVVHPQSLVHSMVELVDGSTLAQLSPPDMKLPIACALAWPERIPGAALPMDWTTAQHLDFEPLDDAAFPAVALARQVAAAGGAHPAVFNAANEEAVAAFLEGRLPFPGIMGTVGRVVSEYSGPADVDLDTLLAADAWARTRARELSGAA